MLVLERRAVAPARPRVKAAHERVRVELAQREVEDEVPVRAGVWCGWVLVLGLGVVGTGLQLTFR